MNEKTSSKSPFPVFEHEDFKRGENEEIVTNACSIKDLVHTSKEENFSGAI